MQHVVRLHLQLRQQHFQDLRVHRLGDLEPDGGAEPAAGQFPLQRLQQVLVAVLLDLEVGVAGDPEQVVGEDLQAGEELGELRGDEVLERQEGRRRVGGGHRDEPGHVVRHLDPREVRRAVGRVADHHRQVQRQPADVGERVGRVHRQGGEHREDLVAEVLLEPPGVLVGQLVPVHDPDAVVLQPRGDVLEEALRLPLHQVLRAAGDQLDLLADGQPVGGADGQAGALPALEAGDADHEELIEVAGEDREELDPLQQGQGLVLGQFEYPGVEVQPGQFPVQEAIGRQ